MIKNTIVYLVALTILLAWTGCSKVDETVQASDIASENVGETPFVFENFLGASYDNYYTSLRLEKNEKESLSKVKLISRYRSDPDDKSCRERENFKGDVLLANNSIVERYGTPSLVNGAIGVFYSEKMDAELGNLFGKEMPASVQVGDKSYSTSVYVPSEFSIEIGSDEPVFNIDKPDVTFSWTPDPIYSHVTVRARWGSMNKEGKIVHEPGSDQITIKDNGSFVLDADLLKNVPRDVMKVQFTFYRCHIEKWNIEDETAELRMLSSYSMSLLNIE